MVWDRGRYGSGLREVRGGLRGAARQACQREVGMKSEAACSPKVRSLAILNVGCAGAVRCRVLMCKRCCEAYPIVEGTDYCGSFLITPLIISLPRPRP